MGYASEHFRRQRLAKHAPVKPPYRMSWGQPSLTSELLPIETPNAPDPALKGKLNGNCNREHCQRPGADWFNTSTRLYYCRGCAHQINRACVQFGDPLILFPSRGAEADAAIKFGEAPPPDEPVTLTEEQLEAVASSPHTGRKWNLND